MEKRLDELRTDVDALVTTPLEDLRDKVNESISIQRQIAKKLDALLES